MFRKVLGLVVMGFITFSNVAVSAANYPVSLYGTLQGGLPRLLEMDWGAAKWADTFEWKNRMPFTVGIGGLFNPAYTGNWLCSVELNGQTLLQPQQENQSWTSAIVDPMVFVLGKVTLPSSENQDWFAGLGGGLMWVKDKKCGNFIFDIGGNRHINNGFYFRGSLRYVKPFIGSEADNKPATLLANVGAQYNLS